MRIFLILMLFTLAFGGVMAVYAFFQDVKPSGDMPQFEVDHDGAIEVDSEYELILMGIDGYYNSPRFISSVAAGKGGTFDEANEKRIIDGINNRKSIKLTQDITLTRDLTFSADLNIDLNGHTIDLNGYNITFIHSYAGCFVITNGYIVNTDEETTGVITIDTPHAVKILDCDIGEGISVDEKNFDINAAIERAFDIADAVFENFHSETINGNIRYYIYRSINLTKNFYHYDIVFDWQSSDENIISGGGMIKAAGDAQLTLTLEGKTIEENSGGITAPLSKQYNIRVLGAASDRFGIGKTEFEDYLDRYKYGGKYYIYSDVELPAGNTYYRLEYEYFTDDDEEPYDLIGNALNIAGSGSGLIKLQLVVKDLENGTERTYPGAYQYYEIYAVTENNYQIANNFINAINTRIEAAEDEIPLTDELDLIAKGASVEYHIVDGQGNEVDNYYIESNRIKVNELPETDDIIYLKAVYTFIAGNPTQLERQKRIYYVDTSLIGGDDAEELFMSCYTYISGLLAAGTEGDGRTFTTFMLPAQLENVKIEYRIRCSSLAEALSQGLSGLVYPEKLLSADTDYVIRLDEGIMEIFGEELPAVVFDININSLKAEKLDIEITYIFSIVEEEERTEFAHKSVFTLHGVIHNRFDGIPDLSLYAAALSYYDVTGDESETPDGILTVYEAAFEKEKFEVIGTPADPVTINNYKGIEYFINTGEFVFDGTGNGSGTENEPMKYLAGLDNLERLTLANNGIGDAALGRFVHLRNLRMLDLSGNEIESLTALGTIYASVDTLILSGNSLTDLNGLEKFLSLNTLYVDGNDIADFRKLLDLAQLAGGEVHLYGNRDDEEDKLFDFGSKGMYSVTTFVLLAERGVTIYDDVDQYGDPVEFTYSDHTLECAGILESIILPSTTKTKIILPGKIYYGGGADDYYEILWDLSALSGYTVQQDTPVEGEFTVNHSAAAGRKIIFAYVRKDAQEEYIYKPFYIEVLP